MFVTTFLINECAIARLGGLDVSEEYHGPTSLSVPPKRNTLILETALVREPLMSALKTAGSRLLRVSPNSYYLVFCFLFS